MKNIVLAHFLLCIFSFCMTQVTNLFIIIPFFIAALLIYIFSGFITTIKKHKTIKYCILGILGLILFIVSFIISPNQLPNKNIDSSFIWVLVQMYLFPFELFVWVVKIDFLKYPSFIVRAGFYLIEIIIIGILPLLGALLRERLQSSKI